MADRTCVVCNSPLSGRQAKYCQQLCASRAFMLARRADGREVAMREQTKAWQAAYGREYHKVRPRSEAAKASDKRRRAIKIGATSERFRCMEVYERDRWRCGLCGKRVDRRKAWPDPMSPSLDHLVPLSEGGAHTKVNAQLAHLSCNQSKHTRAMGEQLRLIG